MFDLDGCLLDITGIRDWTKGLRDDYEEFHKLAINAPPIYSTVAMAQAHWDKGSDIIVLTARSFKYKQRTMEWLYQNNVPWHYLYMRPIDDDRKDAEVKLDHILEIQKSHEILCSFDDHPDIVALWKDLGVDVFQIPGWEDS